MSTPARGTTPGLAPAAVRVAEVVLAHPAVDSLSGGPFGTIATYLPGRRQPGVSLGVGDEPTRIAVVLRLGVRVGVVAEELRRIVAVETGDRRVDVIVTDIALPGPAPAPAPGTERSGAGPSAPAPAPAPTRESADPASAAAAASAPPS